MAKGEIVGARGETIHWRAGHRRLSIIDLDARSDQPFSGNDRVLVFNGEIYNFQALRTELKATGRTFSTSGDTEVLFELLGGAGPESLDRLNGMWAFVHLDQRTRTILASRDRYGKKPLFYHLDDEIFVLSSTMRAIDLLLARRAAYRTEAMAAFLTEGSLFPPADGSTHHAEIRSIRPGEVVSFDLDDWKMEGALIATARPSGVADPDGLPELLADAFAARLVSDRPVALLLSGGIDSSLLLSVAAATGLSGQVHCFVGDTGRSDDARYGREAAALLGVETREIVLDYGSATFDRFLRICHHQEKPFPLIGQTMAMAEMYETISAQGIPVVIDGTGGDELFGGYWDRTFPFALRDALKRGDWMWIAGVLANGRGRRQVMKALQNRSLELPVKQTRALGTYARFQADTVQGDPLVRRSMPFTEALLTDAYGGRLGDWLWQNDRNAMMSSVENRGPFLDYRLANHILSPYGTKYSGRWNKIALRRSFDSFRPIPTQWRVQKQGFRWSQSRFFRENMGKAVDLVASSPMVDEILHRGRLVDDIRRGDKAPTGLFVRAMAIAGLDATRA